MGFLHELLPGLFWRISNGNGLTNPSKTSWSISTTSAWISPSRKDRLMNPFQSNWRNPSRGYPRGILGLIPKGILGVMLVKISEEATWGIFHFWVSFFFCFENFKFCAHCTYWMTMRHHHFKIAIYFIKYLLVLHICVYSHGLFSELQLVKKKSANSSAAELWYSSMDFLRHTFRSSFWFFYWSFLSDSSKSFFGNSFRQELIRELLHKCPQLLIDEFFL